MNQRGGRSADTRAAATFYCDRAQLQAWFDGAGPGQCSVYAIGPGIDPHNETVRTVVGWRDAGLVTCVQGRGQAGLMYQVQKRASLLVAAPSMVASANPSKAGMPGGSDPALDEGDLGRVYRLIARAASQQVACPTNGEIAEALELGTRFHGRRLFDRLVAEGHLRVIERLRFGARVVEITASGRKTKGTTR